MPEPELCTYCGQALGDAEDHVLARAFLPEDKRQGIPKVPACKACNNRKAGYESYIVTTLSLGSPHEAAQHRIKTKLQRALGINLALWRELREGRNIVWEQLPSKLWVPTMSFPLRSDVAPTYFALVVR